MKLLGWFLGHLLKAYISFSPTWSEYRREEKQRLGR